MSDPLRIYQVVYGIVARARADVAQAWKLGLLMAVAVTVAWRLIFSWLHGTISGVETLTLIAALLLAEGAAVRWIRDFQGLRFLLLLALPLAAWLGVEVLARVSRRESYRTSIQTDIRRFRAALQRDPTNAAAHELLGDSYLKLRQPRRAVSAYRSAVALNPRTYQSQYKLRRAARLSRTR